MFLQLYCQSLTARIEPVGSLGELEGIPAISSYNLGNEDLATVFAWLG